jgi:hypothetical protein
VSKKISKAIVVKTKAIGVQVAAGKIKVKPEIKF